MRRLIVATDESPESLANRPLLSLPLSLLVGQRWGRRLGLLGLGGEVGEGRSCVLTREMEDALSAGQFGTEVYFICGFRARWLVCGRGCGGTSIGIVRCGGGRGRDGCVVVLGSR